MSIVFVYVLSDIDKDSGEVMRAYICACAQADFCSGYRSGTFIIYF